MLLKIEIIGFMDLKGELSQKWKFHIVFRFANNDEQKKPQVKIFLRSREISISVFLMTSLTSKATKSLYDPYINRYIRMTINRHLLASFQPKFRFTLIWGWGFQICGQFFKIWPQLWGHYPLIWAKEAKIQIR